MIRELKESELPFIAEAEQICFSTPWSEQSLRESFAQDNNYFYVCELDRKITGYIGLCVAADEGYILNVAVLPGYRGRGFGEELVRYVCERFAELEFITLEVRPSNAPAVGLYTKLGFQKAGLRKNYYRNPVEDALLLTKYFR